MAIRPFQHYQPTIDKSVYVDDMAVIIGNVSIAKDCSIWPFATIRGDIHHISIGALTNIQDNCVLHVTHDSQYHPGGSPLVIGEGVTVGHHVTLHACTIANHCIIGMGSIVLDKAIIEPNVILGAGSLVSPGKVLESGYLWLGAPAIKKRPLTEKELAFIAYSAQSYANLKNIYMQQIIAQK